MMLRSRIISRYCSSAVQESKPRQIPQRLQKKLVREVKRKKSFPSVESSLSLARNLAQIQVTVDHFSKILLSNYGTSTSQYVSIKKLEKDNIDELLILYNTLKKDTSKEIQTSTGILYFKCLHRLLEEIESRAKKNLPPMDFQDPDLIYGQWLAYYLQEKDEHASKLMTQNIDPISSKLILDLKSYASEYSNKTVALPATIPRIFNPGDISFCDKLLQEEKFTPSTIYQILNMKSAALWNAGNYSTSLENFTSVLQYLMENLEDVELGKYAISSLVTMLSTICEHNMKPAVKYLEVILEKIDQSVPIVPYVMVIMMEQDKYFDDKSKEILAKYPTISKLRDDKFEKCIKGFSNSPTTTSETKIEKFLSSIDLNAFKSSFEEEEIINEKVEMSPQLLQDTIDLTVLEMVKAEQLEDAIEFIQQESVAPTKEVISAFAQAILTKGILF